MAFCKNLDKSQSCMEITPTNRRCRYHKRKARLPVCKMAPDGLCPEAFHAVFPLGFAMFSAERKILPDGNKVRCPAGRVVFELQRCPFLDIAQLPRQILHRIINLFYPLEVLRWKVIIKVLTSNDCPYAYSPGATFEVNMGQTDDLCPAAFNSIYPVVAPNVFDENSREVALACPDHKTNVLIRFGSGDTFAKSELNNRICPEVSHINLEVIEPGGEARLGLHQGQRYSVAALLERIGLPCLLYLNTLSPYFRVLREGGKLGFYTGNYNSAIVQCPSVLNKVVARIERNPNDESVSVDVLSHITECPMGMKDGERFIIKGCREMLFWFQALAALSPYIINTDAKDGSIIYFSLPDNVDNPTKFHISSD